MNGARPLRSWRGSTRLSGGSERRGAAREMLVRQRGCRNSSKGRWSCGAARGPSTARWLALRLSNCSAQDDKSSNEERCGEHVSVVSPTSRATNAREMGHPMFDIPAKVAVRAGYAGFGLRTNWDTTAPIFSNVMSEMMANEMTQ